MKIHEFQAKQVFGKFGIPVGRGQVATSPAEAKTIASQLGGRVVVKAQVHVGGRGKAGGVKLADDPNQAYDAAQAILGMKIKGLPVERVLIEEAIDIGQEYYLGITIDRNNRRVVIMVSAAGGIDIEEVAATTPEKIVRVLIDPSQGLLDFQVRQLVFGGGFPAELRREAGAMIRNLYRCFGEADASLAEVNPLVITRDGKLIAADAKMDIDDNALFRQTELATWREAEEEDPIEREAHRRDLAYVHLDGDIGIIGNGAGLVMTTLDIVTREGGRPANFLDIGGGAKAEVVRSALEVVMMEKKVKGVLINVFGGITRCDEVAKGLLEATQNLEVNVPVVVRLIGTREEAGRELLKGSRFIPAATMREAAQRVVQLTR